MMGEEPSLFRRPPAWVTEQRPPDSHRLALRRLANALRDLIALTVDTTASEPRLAALAAEAEALRDHLAAEPRGRTRTPFGEAAANESGRAFLDTSPIIGLANPLAPPMRLSINGESVRGEVTFTDAYEGPPGHVHGGFIAAAFDDVLGATQSATGNPGMTGSLSVRYLRPTPLQRPARLHGRLLRVEGRKIYTAATLHVDGELCAEADAIFISIDFAALYQRLNGAGGWTERTPTGPPPDQAQ